MIQEIFCFEIKALEMRHNGIPMPEKYNERLEDMRNENKEN